MKDDMKIFKESTFLLLLLLLLNISGVTGNGFEIIVEICVVTFCQNALITSFPDTMKECSFYAFGL